jgi:Thioester domain/PEP-CTERM motif
LASNLLTLTEQANAGKKIMNKSWIRWVPIGALSVAASVALGNPFSGTNPQPGSLTWSGFSNGSVAASISGNGGAIYMNVLTGQFLGFFDPASEANGTGPDDFFRFFCIDITSPANGGPNPYIRTLGVPDATNAAQLSRLFDQFYPNKTTGTYYSGAPTNFGSFATADTSAAFQLAVWEIWFDDDLNLATGTFRATSSAAALAQSYLVAVGTGSTVADGWTFYDFKNDSYQDYLSVTYSVPLRTTPEPGTLILLCVAVLTAWAAMRRRQTA